MSDYKIKVEPFPIVKYAVTVNGEYITSFHQSYEAEALAKQLQMFSDDELKEVLKDWRDKR